MEIQRANKNVRRYMRKKLDSHITVDSNPGPILLQMVRFKVYGIEVWTLLDSGAVTD